MAVPSACGLRPPSPRSRPPRGTAALAAGLAGSEPAPCGIAGAPGGLGRRFRRREEPGAPRGFKRTLRHPEAESERGCPCPSSPAGTGSALQAHRAGSGLPVRGPVFLTPDLDGARHRSEHRPFGVCRHRALAAVLPDTETDARAGLGDGELMPAVEKRRNLKTLQRDRNRQNSVTGVPFLSPVPASCPQPCQPESEGSQCYGVHGIARATEAAPGGTVSTPGATRTLTSDRSLSPPQPFRRKGNSI